MTDHYSDNKHCACGALIMNTSPRCTSCAARLSNARNRPNTYTGRVLAMCNGDKDLATRLRTITYGVYQRCYRKSCPSYSNYGARGIKVSDEFLNRETFIAYLVTLPGHNDYELTLDRIKNDKGYERGNLRFVDRSTQMYNRPRSMDKLVLGAMYGELKAISIYKEYYVHCRCTCGQARKVYVSRLVEGHVTMCRGCERGY